ncbi:bifunctional aminoglycoside phosphotransferase/ATP-binding protein [Pseudomonas sp.]|uniref:bifunctional aminoglycoside phosphotransferase/ATP-binding protein n=1 Tax=Pseudomonas sp. TaxID=306 RepID=UPI00272C25DA|nr:bifunctional aminoglycoside phosphotransferase/ATP-binding protein [Pseudomonas sp.]
MSQTLLKALQDPALYDHPVDGFTLMETHISWVLLTGEYVYKVKKPVNFGFLDYSTLEQRAHFCREELRLNRRLAPSLYLDVIPVHGSETAPNLSGQGPVIEYMVKTRQFRQEDLLGNMERAGQLKAEHIDALAERLASFHDQIDQAPRSSEWGQPAQVHAPVAQNFEQIRGMLTAPEHLAQLDELELWANTTYERLIPQLVQRKAEGFVRECHGDIYLDNVTLVDGEVTLFDCIEFNDAFRWIDVMSDVAFMAMDLEDRGLPALSRRFVNGYLEHSGDYSGLAVLNYYKAYRAMVRAKVALLRLGQEGVSEAERHAVFERYLGYTRLAESYTEIPLRYGLVTCGVSGSGKSTLSLELVQRLGVIRLRSDVERKRLFGQAPADRSEGGLYNTQRSEQTYTRLSVLAAQVLAAGYPVVVDATCIKRAQRSQLRELIERQGVPFLLIRCDAPLEVIESWLVKRQASGTDPSDADIAVVRKQLQDFEELSAEEQLCAVLVHTDQPDALRELADRLAARL